MNKKTSFDCHGATTTMLLVPEEEWRNLHDMLEQIIDLITQRNVDDSNSEWIESDEARKLLGVSPKTWQNYRDQRLIPFSQIGRKIYVNRADLDAFLRNHPYRWLSSEYASFPHMI